MCERLQHSSSAHLSSLSTFLHSSIHLSVHSSLHPSVHIAFVPHVDPSVMASVMPVLLYIDISFQTSTFFRLLKTHNFGAVAFFLCEGTEKLLGDFSWQTIILSITITKTQVESNLCSVASNSHNSFDYIRGTLWHHESSLTE